MRKVMSTIITDNKKEVKMTRKHFTIISIAVLILAVAGMGFGQSSDGHTVNIDVQSIDQVDISDAAVTLVISSATFGSGPNEATDNSSLLQWVTNGSSRKITAALDSDLPAGVGLTVQAAAPSGGTGTEGTAAGEVTLTGTAADVVTTISQAYSSSQLTYTANATVAASVATVNRTVTYTITN